MKNRNALDKLLFYIQLIALVILGISFFLFVWSIFIYPKNNIKIVLFGLVGDTLVFLFGIIFFVIEIIYAILFGIIRKKIHISLFSVFLIFFIFINIFYMSLGYEEVEYKVNIEEVNEKLVVTNHTFLHDSQQTVYEKKFFIFYKEIYSDYNTSLWNDKDSEIVYDQGVLILKYHNEFSEYNDPYVTTYLIYFDNEFTNHFTFEFTFGL